MSAPVLVDLKIPLGELVTLLMLSRQRRAGIRYATSPGAREMDRIIVRLETAMKEMVS